MAATLEEVAHDALVLPLEARAELACLLLKSTEAGSDENSEQVWDGEIHARIAPLERGEARTVSAAEVFAKLREIAPE